MTLIKIDRKSVRRNPNAFRDQTTSLITLRMELSFEVPVNAVEIVNGGIIAPMPYPEFILGKNIAIIKADCTPDVYQVRCVAIGTELPELLANGNRFDGVNIESHHTYETIRHMPEPEYFYKYKDQYITCDSCGHKFKHTELTIDEDSEGNYIVNICPKCGVSDCCDIEYEKFDKTKYIDT